MKSLNVIFTYNRPYLLDNCIRSFFACGPEGDLLVFDDNSTLPESRRILEKWRAEGVDVRVNQREKRGKRGGLYDNMQESVDYALGQGYDAVFFIQDDQQFMWRDGSFWNRIEKIFQSMDPVFHVRPQFERLILSHDFPYRFRPIPDYDCWLNLKEWFTAVGVLSLRKIKQSSWRFLPLEAENNIQARNKGLEMVISAMPTLAFVPNPETWHDNTIQNAVKRPVHEFLLKPLAEDQIQKILETKCCKIICAEDFCHPWGWKALAPYQHSSNRNKYLGNLWRWMKKNKRLPRWVGVKS